MENFWQLLFPNTHPGSWFGLPDFGRTEKVTDALGIPRDYQGGSQAFGQYPNSPQDQAVINEVNTNNQNGVNLNRLGTVLGAQTYGGDNSLPTGDNTNNNEVDLGVSKWLADLENAKRTANTYREQGQRTFNDLINAVNAYRERANQQFKNAGQQIINSFSELTGGNARLGQSARQKALAIARSGGYGDSSRLGLLNQVTGNLAGVQGAAMARKGENERANQETLDERMNQAQTQEDTANTYKTNLEQQAGDIERLGIQNAGYDFGGLLNNVMNYQRQLANINPVQANSLTQMSPNFSGIENTLNSLLGGLNSNLSPESQNMAATLVSPTNTWTDLLKRVRGVYS